MRTRTYNIVLIFQMADNIAHPSILAIIGNIGMVLVFTFIGPLPFVKFQTINGLVPNVIHDSLELNNDQDYLHKVTRV